MPQRQSLRLRRSDASVPLRDPTSSDAALRSDFFYIPQELLDARQKLLVEPIDHTSVRVSYDPDAVPVDPTFGTYVEAMVLRSPVGYPLTNLDGYVLNRRTKAQNDAEEGWVTLVDRELTPGRWSYYSLFIKYVFNGNTHWLRVGEASTLLPYEFGYDERLWQMFPQWYRRSDGEGIGASNVLRRLTKALGYETDLHRTWAQQLGGTWDIANASTRILDEIGAALGQEYEEASGMRRYRSLLSNLMFLRKRKGTEVGVSGFLSALTGYRTIAYTGPNLMLTYDDARAVNTVGQWLPSTANDTLTRVVAGSNLTNGPQTGNPYFRLQSINTTSHSMGALLGGDSPTDMSKLIPVVPGRTYKFALSATSSTTDWYVSLRYYTKTGSFIINVDQALTGLDTTWKRFVLSSTAPANAYFCTPLIYKSTAVVTSGVTLDFWRMMFVDNDWRPEAVPGTAALAPLSGSHAGYYDDTNYYEDPRQVWINVYPQRVNLALNSNFTLNNLPAGAWVAADEPTYALLESAYSSYDDIIDGVVGDSESSYDDLAGGFAPTSASWTLAFDTANKRLNVTSGAIGGRHYTQVSTHLYPVHSLLGMSAAVVASSTVTGVVGRLRMRWYASNDTASAILKSDGTPSEHVSEAFVLNAQRNRMELVNASPPANAQYGRLILETDHTASHIVRYEQALIENATSPGPYFDGTVTEGEFGDFFFTGSGAAYLNPSAYYMGYRSFISGVGGADRLTTIMSELLPPGVGYKFLTATNGLY
jgi:hypothetical protein